MSKSIRVSNGKETFEIQDTDLQDAVKDGYLPTERIIVANSKTKESYEIDPQDLPSAMQDGFSFSNVVKKKAGGTPSPVSQKTSFNGVKEAIAGASPLPSALNPVAPTYQPKTQTQKPKPQATEDPIGDLLKPINQQIQQRQQQVLNTKDNTFVAKNPVLQAEVESPYTELRNLQDQKIDVEENAITDTDEARNIVTVLEQRHGKLKPGVNQTYDLAQQRIIQREKRDAVINQAPDLKTAALNFITQTDPQAAKEITAMGGNISQSYVGHKLGTFLNDPYVRERAEKDPKFKAYYDEARTNFTKNFPDLGISFVSNKLSQMKEDEGDGNWFFNYATDEWIDKALDKAHALPQDSPYHISDDEYKLAKSRKQDLFIKTPGLVNNLLEGFDGTLNKLIKGSIDIGQKMANPVANPVQEQKEYSEVMEKDATAVSVQAKGLLHQFTQQAGSFTGSIVPMVLLSKGLGAAGLPTSLASGMAGVITFHQDHHEQALKRFPGESEKQKVFETIMGGADFMLGQNILPKNLTAARSALAENVGKAVAEATQQNVSRAAAREMVEKSILNTVKEYGGKAVDFAASTAKHNVKTTATLTSFNMYGMMMDSLFGGERKGEGDQFRNLYESAKSTFLSAPILSAFAAGADISPAAKMGATEIWDIASNPQKYKEIYKTLPNGHELLKSVEDAAAMKADIEAQWGELPTEKKASILLQDLNRKMLEEKLKTVSSPSRQDKIRQQIKRSKEFAETIRGERELNLTKPKEGEVAYYDDKKNVSVLAQKILKGEELTDEDLQLQQNFSKELEAELQGLAEKEQPKKEPTEQGEGVYEYNGEKYIAGKDGEITRENGTLLPIDLLDEVKAKGTFTPNKPPVENTGTADVPRETEGVSQEGKGEVPTEKVKVYRGTGKNVAEGDNEGIQWVAEDRRVAENYAKDGKVEEMEVEKPKNPFETPFDPIHVRGEDVANRLRAERDRKFKAKEITREEYAEISEAINDFQDKAGTDLELYWAKINKKDAAPAFVKALKLLGFDGLIQKESHDSSSPFTNTRTGNESITYGIFKSDKATPNPKAEAAQNTLPELSNVEEVGRVSGVHAEGEGNQKPKTREQPYQTKSGKYRVEYRDGKRVVVDSDGNVMPETKYVKQILRDHDKQYQYNFGEKADPAKAPQFGSEEEAKRWTIENSNNPAEVAEVYHHTEKESHPLTAVEQAIADHNIGKVTEESYRRYGDENNINNAKARAYFSNKGESIDVIAEQASNLSGIEVTPEDVVAFIDRFPNGVESAVAKRDGEIRLAAADKFKQLTGIDLTDRVARQAALQNLEPEVRAQAQINAEHLIETEPLPENEVANWLQEEADKTFENSETFDNLDTYGEITSDTTTENRGEPQTQSADGSHTSQPQEIGTSEGVRQPGTTGGEENSGEEVKKTVTTIRAYEGEFRAEVKAELEKLGLTRAVEHQDEALAKAKTFVASVGEETAIEAVRAGDVRGGMATAVYNDVIERIDKRLQKALIEGADPETIQALAVEQAALIDEMGQRALEGGRYNSMFNHLYENSELGYNSEAKRNEWTQKFGKDVPEELLKVWKERDQELADLKKKIAELEQQREEAEAKQAIDDIKEDIARKEGGKKTYGVRAKVVADKFRRLKTKPMTFKDADGNEIPVDVQGVSWNDLVELGARVIEKTGEIADGIKAVAEKLREMEWFKKMDERNQSAILAQVDGYFNQSEVTQTGRIHIPTKIIREAVKGGADTIEKVVDALRDEVKKEFPDATDREIRDAVTGYGKTVNPNRDAIATQMRKINRIGRIVSALEDIAEKKRPLRSGLQRDKLDAEERSLQKELREAMKDLPPDSETEQRELKTALDAAKTRMRNQIEDLQREIDAREKIDRKAKPTVPDEELQNLIKERDRLKEEHDKIFGDKGMTMEQKVAAAVRATEKRVEELERRIREKDLEAKKTPTLPETPELKQLRERRKALGKQLREMQREAGILEKKRLQAAKNRAAKRISKLKEKINKGDYSKRKVTPLREDGELVKLKAEKLRIQEEYDKEFHKEQLRNRTYGEKIKDGLWEMWGLTRALQATGEFSFMGVQGLVQSIAHPTHAIKGFKNAIKFLFSEKRADDWLRQVKSQEWYPIVKESKLALTEPKAELTAREELFFSGWTNVLWNTIGAPFRLKSKEAFKKWEAANPFKALERAAVGYLDTIRLERFMDGMEVLKEKGKNIHDHKQDYKDVADVINTLTGRASLGKAELVAPQLAKIFFSPRNWVSIMKTSTPWALFHFGRMTPTARRMALADFSKFVGLTTGLVMMAAARLNNDDDPETGVEFDPTSTDFGKIKIGNTRIDPWGGRIQMITLQARWWYDHMKNGKGEIVPLGTPFKAGTRWDVAEQMAINKLAPSAQILHSYMTSRPKKQKDGKIVRVDKYGNDYSLASDVTDRLLPIYWSSSVPEVLKDPKLDGSAKGLLMFYSFFGGNVQVYDEKPKKK